ncbi:chalcone isomerase family protein [Curvibacter sp. HBC61]|uniref:Chalcone isomerase family protein n=1 Tax=Curvibacter cyanobacteriorum TaxID=3026422 RepID=A0ABT5MZB6_9BURK|nr:chalcone isomerase family protein [Curvibacter sp. HBC61]MDD0839401.1 chalcone isomerase family protein [Curvibacter sp. HBC61]
MSPRRVSRRRFQQHLALGLTGLAVGARAQAPVSEPPLPGVRAAGTATMRFLGLEIYQARLWLSPGFQAEQYAELPLALELQYQRDFTGAAIAKRSLDEMKRIGDFSPEQGTRWLQQLQALLPDVKRGDRLMGLHQPGVGATFKMDGRAIGSVNDPVFSRLFFGIWLSPATSEPKLRQALLSQASP